MEWILLGVILWYIIDSVIYLWRYYSKGGARGASVSIPSPFETIPAKLPGYHWMHCRSCGQELAMMLGEPDPIRCLGCGAGCNRRVRWWKRLSGR